MAMLLAASLLLTAGAPPAADAVIGPGAYYAPDFDRGGWDAIITQRIRWGQLDAGVMRDGMYCVSPDHALGDRLAITNAVTGTRIVCVVADVVAPGDEAHWREAVVIEMSYAAFVAADGPAFNRFVVTAVEGPHG